MATKIAIEIKDCSQCPHFDDERVYTADNFEMVFKWTCTKAKRQIAGYVETFDKVPIPDWCPCKI
ncbi:MAG: hypothetical protein WC428_08450 [Candidatus Paceibacterota bacterium]|jgi:hypothetical protein